MNGVRDTGRLEAAFKQLAAVLDQELERQENVLSLCRAQGEAVSAHDAETLVARTQALRLLLEDTLGAERARVAVVRDLVELLNLPVERQTLTGLIAVAPAPWDRRLREYQVRLREVLEATRGVVRANAVKLRHGLRLVHGALDMFGAAPSDHAYSAGGVRNEKDAARSMLLNAQG